MMNMVSRAIALAVLTTPAAAAAQTSAPASTTDERRLTPEQVEAVLAEAAAKRAGSNSAASDLAPADTPVAVSDEPPPAPQVHGEVGFTIGTGGYRGAHGTAVYPLDDGIVAISFDYADWGRRRVRR